MYKMRHTASKPHQVIAVILLLGILLCSCQQDIKTFRVSFVLEEKPFSFEDVPSGQKVSVPVPPSRKGYSVIWYTDEAATKEYDFSLAVSSSFTLYGKWVASQAPIPEPRHLVYNGAEQRGIDESEMYVCRGTVAATDVGYYRATASLNEGFAWTDGTTEDKTVAWTISRRPVSVTGESATVSYDGSRHTLVGHTTEGLLQKHVLTGLSYTAEGTDYGTFGGVFSGTAVIRNGQQDVTGNYDIILSPGTLRIIRAEKDNEWTEEPSISGWTYGGQESDPTGKALYGTVSYTYSATEDFETITDKPATAGTWYMKASVPATEAYGSLEKKVCFTIEKAKLSISGIVAEDKEYDGTSNADLDFSNVTAEGLVPGDSLTYSATGRFSESAPGEYDVTISDLSISGEKAPNYIIDSVQERSRATIGPRTLRISGISAVGRAYDGTTAVTLTGGLLINVIGDEEVFLESEHASASMTTPDAGTGKAVTVTGFAITGKDTGNYVLEQPQGLTVDIAKAPSVMTKLPEAGSIGYDGQPHPMATAGECEGGTVEYSADSLTWNASVPTMTRPGEYTLRFRVTGDSNHTDLAADQITCRINPLVSFSANGHGTAPAAVHVTYGTALQKPADPQEAGVEFLGWFTDNECTSAYDFSRAVDDNMTLYAKWAANQCTISFDADGGTAVTTVLVRTYGNTFGTLPETSREGFFFAGWYDGETLVTESSTVLTVGSLVLKASWTPLFTVSGNTITEVTAKGLEMIASSGKLEVPASIAGSPITAFEATELSGNTSVTSIDLSDVSQVGEGAFTGCSAVGSVTACPSALKETLSQLGPENGVTSVTVLYREGDTTTAWTSNSSDVCCAPSLTSAEICEGIETIPAAAFRRCTKLSSVSLPASLKALGERCFQETALTALTLPAAIDEIPDRAFYNCPDLVTIDIGSSVDIGSYAFWFCPKLQTVSGGNLINIGSYAFQMCAKLSSINLASVETVGPSAFNSCSALTSLDLPAVRTLHISCFAYCDNLKTVTTGIDDKEFGSYAFGNCSSLEGITISGTATAMGTGVFSGCQDTTVISFTDMTGPLPSWTSGWSGPCIVEYKE